MTIEPGLLSFVKDLDYAIEKVEQIASEFSADRRPSNEQEAELWLNMNRLATELRAQRREEVLNVARQWSGWKTYEQMKAERAARR